MNNFIKYWSYLVENENKEISFETFLEKKSSLFEASMKWPDDYLKKAKDRIMNSPLGKSDWYKENHIDIDLIDNFKNRFETLRHKGDFTLGFFLSIIKWFIEYSGSDFNKYQEFIEGKLDKIIGILNYIVNQKDDENSKFHEISKTEKDKDGNPLVLRFKKLKDMSWSNFEKEVFQKYSDQISKSVELKNDNKSSDYEIVPIYSYDELHDKFGGDKTGYEGRSEWCHTNGEGTYNSSAWTDNGNYMFIVFAKKDWENITPPDPKTTNAYDDYGTSLIACLFNTDSKKLLHSTLRWNHVIDPATTKIGASVDNAFLNENDLMNTVGIDLSKDLDEYFAKFREINGVKFVTIGGKDFDIEDENVYCDNSELTSLEGAPQNVVGSFYCYKNELTSLKGGPQKVGGNFVCFTNKLSSLEGAPREVDKHFDCSDNKLKSLEGAPQKVGRNFTCYNNKLTSLKGSPQEIGGNFDCYSNKLTSLEGCPQKIGRDFNCSINKLISLKGTPQKISGSFSCAYNQLTSLKGAPQKVDGHFSCDNNQLTSLVGAPKEVSRNFYCSDNQLTSLEGAPEYLGGDFICYNNPDLPKYKIDAYKAYLKLSDSEKAPLTKNNHYYPTEEWENKFKH